MYRKAPHCWRLFCLCLLLLPAAAGAASCKAGAYDARVRVTYVIDGDTVVLGSGEHLRLIGLDTPEINHEGGPSEPGALDARATLRALLHGPGPYPLIYGRDRHDHYGRTLGHLFLPDGRNVQDLLLRGGHATPLTIPPDVRFLDCYRAAAAAARAAHRGIWALPRYRPVAAAQLSPDAGGYHIVRGVVTHIGDSRNSVWLDLGRGFAVRIARTDLAWFGDVPLHGLSGRRIEAGGLVYRRGGELRMRLHHEADLRVLPEPPGNR